MLSPREPIYGMSGYHRFGQGSTTFPSSLQTACIPVVLLTSLDWMPEIVSSVTADTEGINYIDLGSA